MTDHRGTMRQDVDVIHETGIDAAAIKPAECDVSAAAALPVDSVTVDFEGREHLPAPDVLADLADAVSELRVTVPVRADGFDPLGDDSLLSALPSAVERVFVAGHPAYLDEAERRRSVAPRLREAVDRHADAWVGTEGVERVALATGATQYELLSRTTERDLRSLRTAGFDGDVAVYAPTVLTDDEDAVLDAVGAYAARRREVASALPDGAPADASATGRAREVLLRATRDYALAGDPDAVRSRVRDLRDAGADTVVGYPARGVESFR